MPTIHNDTVTTFHLRAPDPDDTKSREEGRARKPAVRKTLGPQSSVQVTEKEIDALLATPAWKSRLEKAGDGQYRVQEHSGVSGDFDRVIRARRREKARAEAEKARAGKDVDALQKRIEALESQATADKQVSSKDTSGDGGEPKSGGKGGGGKKQG